MVAERWDESEDLKLSDALDRTDWSFYSGSQLTFGPGAIRALQSVINRRKLKRVLVVTDTVLSEAGIVAQAENVLAKTSADWTLFTEGEVEPSTSTVARVAELANSFQPDLFVAIGGGSNMDLAKAAAASFTHNMDAERMLGFDQVPGPTTPLVCLPTTAGTGSEVTHSAVLKSAATGQKGAILSQYLRPDVAIVDPNLTISCPPKVTAECGFDAITHAIEALLVNRWSNLTEDQNHGLPYEGNHPLGDLFAEKAISLIASNLQRAVGAAESIRSRSGMALAATLAGMAFSSCGVSLAHALEYPLGAKYGCSHGIGNAIVLPAVMRFWIPERETQLARIATLLGVVRADTMPPREAAEAGIQMLEKLRASVQLPSKLSEVGATHADIQGLAENSLKAKRLLDLSPRKANLEDITAMLSASM
ncbi:MAG: iron-containing alcohol dehydrogenase [Rubripirellula sp.]|nr:iron-containing alcohol dehydrogenase [Rubripirellula sp.]